MPLLSVENLTLLRQQLRRRWFQYQLEEEVLIGCISFSIEKATRLAFAREKHSFNYALCLAIMKLHEISEGTIHFAEVETRLLGDRHFRRLRKKMQAVFSDQFGQLTPAIRALYPSELDAVERQQVALADSCSC